MTSYEFSSYADMVEEGVRYRRELEMWMEDHGHRSKKPRPEQNIAHRERRLAWVIKAVELFERGAAAGPRKQEGASA